MKKHILKLAGTALLIMAVILTQIPATEINAVSQANNGFMMDGDKLVKYTDTDVAVPVYLTNLSPSIIKPLLA